MTESDPRSIVWNFAMICISPINYKNFCVSHFELYETQRYLVSHP